MIKTIDIQPHMMAAYLAKRLASHDVLTWKFNGDFKYIDWEDTQRRIRDIILNEFLKE
jgi:hypothetical protein